MSSGDGRCGDQTFNAIPEMGTDGRGRPHPRDVWPPVVPYYARSGRLRYPNQLSPAFADQAIRVLSNERDLVVDFFAGAGTVPRMCLLRGRRCHASDLNASAIQFTMATICDIVQSSQQSRLACPPLFETGTGLFPELNPDGP
jgi:DNA modification methylase